MKTPCQQPSDALGVHRVLQTASDAWRSFPLAIMTPCPTPCQQEKVGTSGPPGLAELQITLAALLGVELWLSFIYGSYNGAMVVALTEIVPAAVRTAGFSLAYALATALFGGFTPLVSTWLIGATGDRAAPGLWMGFAGLGGLIAAVVVYSSQAVQARAAREGQVA